MVAKARFSRFNFSIIDFCNLFLCVSIQVSVPRFFLLFKSPIVYIKRAEGITFCEANTTV